MKKFIPLIFIFLGNAHAATDVHVLGPVKISTQSTVFVGYYSPASAATVNATASGETVLISSPGANTSIYLNKISMHNAGSSDITVSLVDGTAGTIFYKADVPANGGAVAASFGSRGRKLTANTQLNVKLSAAGNVDTNIMEYYTAP